VQVGTTGNSMVISVTPTGAGGTSYNVMTLRGSGALSLGALPTHCIT
jgi:hypothetical protein